MRPHKPKPPPSFPHPGTDRRPDELERNLNTESDAVTSLERAVETDRVADEDREVTHTLEGVARTNRRLIDTIAIAVLILLVATICISTYALVIASNANRLSKQVQKNSASIEQVCDLVARPGVDCP